MVTKICQACGKEYQVYPYRADGSKYCSRECYREGKKGHILTHIKPKPQNKIACKCANCGEIVYKWPYQIKKSPKVQFCNRQCSGEYRKKRTIVLCEWCGKDVYYNTCHLKRVGKYFCDKECQRKWQSANVKEKNHPLYNQIEVICDQCGKTFNRKPSHINRAKQSFCSRECHFNYQRTHPISDEQRKILRETAFKTMQAYPRETTIEKAIREWLESRNITHIPQHVINDKFCVDFYLPEHDVIIEALGDYFHANPKLYSEDLIPLNDIQIKNSNMDKARFAYLRKCGYKVYGFWECDIHANLEKLMMTVKELQINEKHKSNGQQGFTPAFLMPGRR